jgi:hypothetical protein
MDLCSFLIMLEKSQAATRCNLKPLKLVDCMTETTTTLEIWKILLKAAIKSVSKIHGWMP